MIAAATVYVSTVILKDDQVLFVQESEAKQSQWNLPSGRLELGETLTEAAIREVKEETGYDVSIDSVITIKQRQVGDTVAIIFFFTGSLENDEQSDAEEGIQRVEFMPVDDIGNLDLRFDEMTDVVQMAANSISYPLDILMNDKENIV